MESARISEVRQSMFRAMKAEAARDLPIGQDGMVEPRTGGMPVALDAVQNLLKPRLPRSLGGEGRDPVFTMFTAGVPQSLVVRADRYPHALVEPGSRRLLGDFESDLASTRWFWRIHG